MIESISGAISVDNPQVLLMALSFRAMNEITFRYVNLPCFLSFQLNMQEVIGTLNSQQEPSDALA